MAESGPSGSSSDLERPIFDWTIYNRTLRNLMTHPERLLLWSDEFLENEKECATDLQKTVPLIDFGWPVDLKVAYGESMACYMKISKLLENARREMDTLKMWVERVETKGRAFEEFLKDEEARQAREAARVERARQAVLAEQARQAELAEQARQAAQAEQERLERQAWMKKYFTPPSPK
jgi:hypothetical protein